MSFVGTLLEGPSYSVVDDSLRYSLLQLVQLKLSPSSRSETLDARASFLFSTDSLEMSSIPLRRVKNPASRSYDRSSLWSGT